MNFAAGPSSKGNGALEQNSGTPWVAGFVGGALAGGDNTLAIYNRVRSTWIPSTAPLTGDVTMAFFAKLRTPHSATATNYLSGTSGSGHRLFTGGVAGTGLMQRVIVASGPTTTDLALPATAGDFQALAAAGWVHIGLVVDSVAGTADWYVNGLPVLQIAGVGPALINSTGNYLVGQWATTSECNYDLDEWILDNRAYSAAEMLALGTGARAGDASYTSNIPSQCGAGTVVLGSAGGRPSDGNASYALTVSATSPQLFVLLAGFDRCTFGGALPLPLDGTPIAPFLAGCWIVADAPVTIGGAATPTASVPLPIPLGLPPATSLYSQVLGLDAATFAASMSNGFAISIGH